MAYTELFVYLPEDADGPSLAEGAPPSDGLNWIQEALGEVLPSCQLGTFLRFDTIAIGPDARPAPCAVFAVNDPEAAELVIGDVLKTSPVKDRCETRHGGPVDSDVTLPEGPKFIEIYYDVDTIPAEFADPLDFRNAAMELIEAALEEAGAGEWVGADYGANLQTGKPEVNFGFEVEDYDEAEAIIRQSVANTPFAGIRQVMRA